MIARRLLTATLMMTSALTVAQTSKPEATSHAVCRQAKDYRIVAERSVRNRKQALATDADGRAVLLSVGEGGHIDEIEPLGYEQQVNGFPFAGSLPKEQVIILLRRVSCGDQSWKLWIAQTIGFEEPPRRKGTASLVNHVFVFREGKGDISNPVLAETFRDVSELVVDDVNGDQRTEIAVLYSDEDAGSWMKIWQVEQTGNLREIPLDNVRRDLTEVPGQVEIGLGDYRHGGELLSTEQRLQTSKGWHVTRRYYDWDDAKQRYELSEVVQSEEIITK